MNKFKVGDSVIAIKDSGDLSIGRYYVVKRLSNLFPDHVYVKGLTGCYGTMDVELVTTIYNSVSPVNLYKKARRVYVSTPLKPEKFRLSLIQEHVRKAGVFAFIPTTVDTSPEAGAAINKLQIELCDEVWVFGPIGRDCSWEIGYAQGLKKPVKFFQTEENQHMVKEDWMLFCAGTEVVNE